MFCANSFPVLLVLHVHWVLLHLPEPLCDDELMMTFTRGPLSLVACRSAFGVHTSPQSVVLDC